MLQNMYSHETMDFLLVIYHAIKKYGAHYNNLKISRISYQS